MKSLMSWQRTVLLALVGGLLVAVSVWPQLSARATGSQYRLVVEPVDPIDPFRGAYATLGYPGLNPDPTAELPADLAPRHDVYVPLVRSGDGATAVWTLGEHLMTRPAQGPYLKCSTEYARTECGIESWFMPQAKAASVQQDLAAGRMVAVVKVDSRGNAALVDLRRR